jgi:hypothetical protein
MLTLLIVAGATVALTATFVLTTRTAPAEALAGETTMADAVACSETLSSPPRPHNAARTEWQLATVAALSDAEELLDLLENQGFAERELVVLGNSTFAVRWR